MKNILSLLLLFTISSYSQSSVIAYGQQKPLSETEFQKAKILYAKMVNTKTYRKHKIYMNDLNTKLNDLSFAPDRINYNDRDITEKWLTDNLDKTNLTSVDEGVDLIQKAIKMMVRLLKENTEVYSLLGRADETQRKQITAAGQ